MSRSIRRARRGMSLTFIVLVLTVAAAVAGGAWYWQNDEGEGNRRAKDLIYHTLERGSFDHIVLEQGEIESSSNTEVICEVEGSTAILWVIDEGTRVSEGELLVQLDKSLLEDEIKQQRIAVNGARAQLISSEAMVEQSKIARTEYLEGTYETEEKAILSEMAIAEQDLRKAQLALKSNERLVAKGLVKSLQLEADEFAVANARNQLEASQGRLRVLQELTKQKMLVQFDSEIEKARAQLESDRSILEEEEAKLEQLKQQIAACDIRAPTAGVVVHANEYSRRGNSEFVVEAGAMVRERQAIIRLPDPSKMQVKASINEGRITLVEPGMPVKIRMDAIHGLELIGRVTKVNRYAEPGSWFSSQVKEYATYVEIIDPPETIRTGMTAEVQIFVEQQPNALQIPLQGIYEHARRTFALVRTPAGNFETRPITIVATNDKMAAISEGLEEGEVVVLNLRNNVDLLDLPAREEIEQTEELASDVEEQAGPLELEEEDADEHAGAEGPQQGGPGGPGQGGPRASGDR